MKPLYLKLVLLVCETLLVWPELNLGVPACTNVHPVGVANKSIIPDTSMSASSAFRKSVDYLTAKFGRLNGSRAWCPVTSDGVDWLQVDLGTAYFVCGVTTQGKSVRTDEWAYNYTLKYSRDAVTWMDYTENGEIKMFAGNTDGTTPVRNNLNKKTWTRYLRFYPKDYFEWPCLRVEIYVELTAPVIVTKPITQTLSHGDNLLLDCLSKGSPKPEVTWTLNGNDVVFGKVLSNGSLLVKKVENDKYFEGRYTCVVRNKAGSTKSYADVTIHAKPQILKSLPAVKSYLRGSNVLFSCYALGDPEPIITWSMDGKIPRGEIHNHGNVLVITDIRPRDVGVYRCTASNYLGNAISETNLTIIDHPTINTILTRQTVLGKKGQKVNIGCYGDSVLPLNYSWTKDGQPVTSNDGNRDVGVYGNLLVVTPRTAKDYGPYVCHVTSKVDTVKYSIVLSPFEKCKCSGVAQASYKSDCSGRLEIILPLLFLIFLSVAVIFYLVYRLCRTKTTLNSQAPIPMNTINGQEQESHLIKDTEIAWDNLIPEDQFNETAQINAEVTDGSDINLYDGDEVKLVRTDAV